MASSIDLVLIQLFGECTSNALHMQVLSARSGLSSNHRLHMCLEHVYLTERSTSPGLVVGQETARNVWKAFLHY